MLALGSQVEVDVPDALGRRGPGDEAAQAHRQPGRLLEVGGRRSVVDEHHVEVAGVRKLRAAEAAEGDHGERQRRLDGAEGGFQTGLGDRRHAGTDVGDGAVVEHVAPDDAEQVTILPAPQGPLALLELGSPADRERRRVDQLGPLAGRQPSGIGEASDEVRVALEGVGGQAGRADQVAEPACRLG